jgi:hypothetical protein
MALIVIVDHLYQQISYMTNQTKHSVEYSFELIRQVEAAQHR